MKVYIFGRNRAEIGKIKLKDVEKHFYTSRRQLYIVRPDNLTRVFLNKYGHPEGDDEIIVYKENALIPYHPRNGCYYDWKIMAEIDEHKIMLQPKKSPIVLAMKSVKDISKALSGSLVGLIVVGVIIYAFVF